MTETVDRGPSLFNQPKKIKCQSKASIPQLRLMSPEMKSTKLNIVHRDRANNKTPVNMKMKGAPQMTELDVRTQQKRATPKPERIKKMQQRSQELQKMQIMSK